jgi:hypothetical protein
LYIFSSIRKIYIVTKQNFLIITLAYNFIFVGLWFTSHFSNLPYVMYKKVQTLRNCLLFFKLKWYYEPFKYCTCISQQHNKYFLDMLCFDRKRGKMLKYSQIWYYLWSCIIVEFCLIWTFLHITSEYTCTVMNIQVTHTCTFL